MTGFRMTMATAGCLLVMTAGLATTADKTTSPDSPVKGHSGVFAIMRSSQLAANSERVAALDGIDGLTVYIGLSRLMPRKGEYDWSLTDRAVEACRRYDKKINLAIVPGRWVPEWIYGEGVQKFTWELHSNHVEPGRSTASAPIPWDPVYLQIMRDAVKAMGKRYRNTKEIVAVQVTGPALANGLEANLAISPEQAAKIGYTPEKLIGAWKTMFEACDAAFPDRQLSWSIHDIYPGKRDPVPGRAIRDWAFSRYGKRLSLMVCYLTPEEWFVRGNQAVDIWAERGNEIHLGAQLIDLYSAKKAPATSISAAMRKGALLGAHYFEVFAEDVMVPAYYAELVKARNEIYGGAHPALRVEMEKK